MKKLYTLFFIALTGVTFAQNAILTAVLDGPCTGGVPKILEIYASGTVDFANINLENQTNDNTAWGTGTSGTQSLASFGTRTNEFVYVIMTNAALAVATAEYSNITAANSLESGTMNLNGNDRVRLVNATTSAVIDQFGESDVNGTGTAWEWVDSWAKRVNGTGPDGAFVIGNWTFGGINVLDGTGTCNAAAALSTIVPLGTYSLGIDQNSIAGLSVYPNPVTNGNLFVTSSNNAVKSVVIYDVVGKQVASATVTGQPINVSNLNSGVYIVKVTEEGKTATRKLVIR
jgi:hypothetical protein